MKSAGVYDVRQEANPAFVLCWTCSRACRECAPASLFVTVPQSIRAKRAFVKRSEEPSDLNELSLSAAHPKKRRTRR